MKDSDLVSIIIAAYNMGQYLPLAVQSVLRQTYKNLEIHVIDDGSTDNTREIMRQFAHDNRVHYHYQQHEGQPQAKNTGIRASNGSFIAFCDADDLWLETKLELQLPCFSRLEKVAVVYTNSDTINESGEVVCPRKEAWHRYSGPVTERLFIRNFVTFGTAIVRKKCLDAVGMFDESLPMSIDWDLWLRISTRYDFYYLDEVTYLWREWGGQLSRDYRGRYENTIKIMEEFIAKHPDLLPPKVIHEAWADTYVGRGNSLATGEGDLLGALHDYLRAILHKPSFAPAWKSLAKLLSYKNLS